MTADRVLVVDDEAMQRQLLRDFLQEQGYEVLEAGDGIEAVEQVKTCSVDAILLDQRMPRLAGAEAIRALRAVSPDIQIIVMTAYATVEQAVQALHQGATDYLTKPLDLNRLSVALSRALERRVLIRENRELRRKLAGGHRFEGIVGSGGAMQEVLSTVARAAPTDATVLIVGESGTGKELIARATHAASRRAEGPFVPVHCTALAEGVLESELFGHERGSFTGAYRERRGRFEAAHEGTIFLDEIADMPQGIQTKLLRVLQERRIERVGSNTSRQIDIRVMAATNRDPHQEVREGRLREDLYYRLAVVAIQMPPLRRRREDIPELVEHFLNKYRESSPRAITGVSREAMDALMRYDYPGNVRECENIVHRAIVFARSGVITLADLPAVVRGVPEQLQAAPESEATMPGRVARLEAQLIAEALRSSEGVQCRAAERLGISERTLRYKLKKYAILREEV